MKYATGIAGTAERNNVLHTVSSTDLSTLTSSSPLYFPDKGTNMNFLGYYPYTTSVQGLIVNYTLPLDQSNNQALGQADILYATTTVNGTTPNINLKFYHQMSLLTLKIKCKSLLGSGTLKKVTISGNKVLQAGTLDLSSGTLTPNSNSAFSPFVSTTQLVNTLNDATVNLIIAPCTITDISPINQLNVTLYFEGLLITQKTYKFALNTNNTLVFGKGTYNICTLNVSLPTML